MRLTVMIDQQSTVQARVKCAGPICHQRKTVAAAHEDDAQLNRFPPTIPVPRRMFRVRTLGRSKFVKG